MGQTRHHSGHSMNNFKATEGNLKHCSWPGFIHHWTPDDCRDVVPFMSALRRPYQWL